MRRYESSGLTAIAYCRKHNISIATFYYWRKRISDSPPGESPQFEEISVQPKNYSSAIVVQFPQGVTIQLEGPVSALFLRQLAGLVVSV